MQNTYKVIDLFGNEELRFVESSRKKPNIFTDYEKFTQKFEAKRTTDDCYTPTDVFEVVLNYVNEKCDLSGMEIIRPFYPGGDYEAIEYPDNCVVIDNPPFSIISKIAKFYIAKKVRFFLFAPHLTLFSSDIDCTHIVCGAHITYENKAYINTSFLSNMFGNAKVIGDVELRERLDRIECEKKISLPKYEYPNNVLTVSNVTKLIDRGVSFRVDKSDTAHCRSLDSQKKHGKALFGSGFLLSQKAAAEKAAAEKAAAIVWELSEKEKQIIASLG